MIDESRFDDLLYYIDQRERARVGHAKGTPAPWCQDETVQNYRFCNVDRQDDPVTKMIQRYYFDHPLASPGTLWFNIVIGRVFNNPETLQSLGYIDSWNQEAFNANLKVQQSWRKLYNAAYMIHARTKGIPKHEYYAADVFGPMWEARADAPIGSLLLADWGAFIGQFNSMGPFMRNQMVADIRYSPYNKWNGAKFTDWSTCVEAGPGTLKGLNYLHGKEPDDKVEDSYGKLMELQALLMKHPMVPPVFEDPNNCSNVMCEFSKFMKVRCGHGTPKQKYSQQ